MRSRCFAICLLAAWVIVCTPRLVSAPQQSPIDETRLVEARYELLFHPELGGVRAGPETALPNASPVVLELKLANRESALFVNVLLSEPKAQVRIQTPSGQWYTPENARYDATKQKPEFWLTGDARQNVFPEEPRTPFGFDLSLYLFPQAGTQHLLVLSVAEPGTYRIEVNATPAGKPVELRAAMLPVDRLLRGYISAFSQLAEPQQGEVAVVIRDTPGLVYQNDPATFDIEIRGDYDPQSLTFTAKQQFRPAKPGGASGQPPAGTARQRPSPASQASQLLRFEPVAKNLYRANLPTGEPGELAVDLTVAGRHRSGDTFSRTLHRSLRVKRRLAILRGLRTRPVDTNGNGRWDALEVDAELDVFEAGLYTLRVSMTNNANSYVHLELEGAESLPLGVHRVVARTTADTILRDTRGNGPFVSTSIRIERVEKDSTKEWIPTDNATVKTEALSRDSWDPGSFSASSTLQWRAVDRLGTGKAQFLEFDWPVTTEGGMCQWHADLFLPGENKGVTMSGGMALLAPGPVVLPLDVAASALIRRAKAKWRLIPSLSCNSNQNAIIPMDLWPEIEIDPAGLEDAPPGVFFARRPPELLDLEMTHDLSLPILQVPGPYSDLRTRILSGQDGLALSIRPPDKVPEGLVDHMPATLKLRLEAEESSTTAPSAVVEVEVTAGGRTERKTLRFQIVRGEARAAAERADRDPDEP